MLTAIILAVSIESSSINTFMRLPNWMPTSVDAAHTFGSEDHTNATRRTTADTLAAVESVFDAYYERMFFMSEGRSNDWDTAQYGPRPSTVRDLQSVEFTNFPHYASSMFVYRPADTNATDYPRQVTDTRRLVEFGNLFSLADKITLDFFDEGGLVYGTREGIFLPYKPTWIGDYRRVVYPGSSWMPGELHPDEFDWREGFPSLSEWAFTNCCLPVYECATDGIFRVTEEYRLQHGFYNLHTRWLLSFDFGELFSGYHGSEGPYINTLEDSRPWVDATVPDLIRAKFPLSSPESGITNRTRRLMKDDYLTYDVTFAELNICSTFVDLDLSEVRPEDSPWGGEMDYDYLYDRMESYEFDVSSNSLTSVTVETTEGPSDSISWSGLKQVECPGDYDRMEVYLSGPAHGYVISSSYEGDCLWHWMNPSAQIGFNFWKYVATTNAVYTNSSVVATESRVLSMLDRSYEIADKRFPAGMYSVTSNLMRTISSSVSSSGYSEFFPPATGDGWEQGEDDCSVILRADTDTEATISLKTDSFTWREDVTGPDENYNLTRAKFRFSGLKTELGGIVYTSTGFDADYKTNGITPIAGSAFTHSLRAVSGDVILRSTENISGASVEARVSIVSKEPRILVGINYNQVASLMTTTPAMRDCINQLYPWYGPGRLSFSTFRVEDCIVTLCAAIELLKGVRQPDNKFIDHDSWTLPLTDLNYHDFTDTRAYTRKFLYSVRYESAAQNASVVNLVYEALGSGWARDGLISKCTEEMGGEFSPYSLLVGDIKVLVKNSFGIARYKGGNYYIRCPRASNMCFPGLYAGFEVNHTGEAPELDYDKAFTAPVSADLLLSDPLISTQWKWHALKTERNDK